VYCTLQFSELVPSREVPTHAVPLFSMCIAEIQRAISSNHRIGFIPMVNDSIVLLPKSLLSGLHGLGDTLGIQDIPDNQLETDMIFR